MWEEEEEEEEEEESLFRADAVNWEVDSGGGGGVETRPAVLRSYEC